MEYLCSWINDSYDEVHPILLASIAHYNMVRIHPFDDGNGRGARLLMNLLLIRTGFPPAIIKNETGRKYFETLAQTDEGNIHSFIEFITDSCIDTEKLILDDLKKY